MVAPVLDVARFFYTLLADPSDPGFVSPALLKEMRHFKPLDVGWAKGYIQYGIGACGLATGIDRLLYWTRPRAVLRDPAMPIPHRRSRQHCTALRVFAGLMIQQTSPQMIVTHHPPQLSDEVTPPAQHPLHRTTHPVDPTGRLHRPRGRHLRLLVRAGAARTLIARR